MTGRVHAVMELFGGSEQESVSKSERNEGVPFCRNET